MWRMTRIYDEYDWALKVLRMVFRIKFKDMGGCAVSYGIGVTLCIRGPCLCIDV